MWQESSTAKRKAREFNDGADRLNDGSVHSVRMTMTEISISDILRDLPERIGDVVKASAERSPDWPAIVEGGSIWTYRQLAAVISKTQVWLCDLGVRPGDRVMIVCENCLALVSIMLASAAMGAWPVLVNASLSAREVDEIRRHSRARRVFYTAAVSPRAAEHAKRHGATIDGAAELGSIGISPLDGTVEPEPVEANSASDVAALIYTSGTTGLAKGVMLTHKNLLFVAAVSARIRKLTPDDRLYGVLPMTHAVGLSVVLLGTLLSGATLYLVPRFDPMTTPAALQKDRLTILLGVPAMFAQLLQYAKLRNIASLNCPALRIISSSGAPLQATIKSATENLFGMVLHNGYGISECSPTLAQTRVEAPRRDTSVGPPFPGVEVKLLGKDGKPVPEGEVGELRVRGPNIMKGYYRAPDETAAAIDSDGWFNTRDLARLDNGNLFIVGRTKDLIVHVGLNVYPAEVEAVLNAHPSVVRSAVIGKPIEGDEEIIAFVQTQPSSTLTRVELAEYAAGLLASYKRPSRIVFVPTIPLTPTGKVMKGELAKMTEFIARPFEISQS